MLTVQSRLDIKPQYVLANNQNVTVENGLFNFFKHHK